MAKKDVKSEMGDFIPESVASAVVPLVKGNAPFTVTEHGKKIYIGMLLDVLKIGGINKKSVNDKDKGGVIEAIKSGHVDAYVTKELNDDNKLLFIPTYSTLDRLGDYGMFRNVEGGYEFVKLNDKLEITHTDIFGTYDDFRNIGNGSADIKEFVKPDDVIVAGSAEDPTVSHNVVSQVVDKAKGIASTVANAVAPVVNNVSEKIKDKISESSGLKDMQGGSAEKPVEQPAAAPEPEKEEAPAPVQNTPASPAAPAQPAEDEQEVVYSETQVLTSIERVFHADNLDLPLSSEPFDQLFTLNNHLIKFDVDSRDTYVNKNLNQMAIDANRDLQKLRADNIRKLRDKYFMLMSVRIQEIQKEFDIDDQTKEYGSLKASLEEAKSQRLKDIGGIVEERRATLEDAYNKRMEEVAENAARQAKVDFKTRYQRQHNDDINAVEGVIRAEILANHTSALNDLYIARRNDALTALDLNITGVLSELTEDYKKMFEEENAMYIKRADEMREAAKRLHLEDAQRLAIEEEKLRISNEVNDARAAAEAKIALIQREFETAQSALEARSTATIAQAQNETVLIKEQMNARTAALEQDKERLQQQLDEAIERADKAKEIVRADYEHRLTQAQDDSDSWKQTLEAYKEQHKHNNRLAAILVFAITVAAVAGGFVAGGVYWNRIVSSELAGNKESTEIKVVNPDVTEAAETDITKAVDEAITDLENNEISTDTDTDTADEAESEVTAEKTEGDDNDAESSVVTTVTTETDNEVSTTIDFAARN